MQSQADEKLGGIKRGQVLNKQYVLGEGVVEEGKDRATWSNS